jgi:hypothetical protein
MKSKIKEKIDENIWFKGISGVPMEGLNRVYSEYEIKELIRCMDDFIYFCGKYIKIVDQSLGKTIPFELYDYQKNLAKTYNENNRVIVLAPRQSGKSIFTIAYLLWYALFHDYQNIVLIANKANTAKKTLRKLKEMFIHLPQFLKQGVTEWNKTQIIFENNSKIYAEATSSSGNRGDTVSILYIDECAIIEKGLMEDFFASVYPTIASVKNAKIIISSTPKGYNFFYLLWSMAVNKQSDYKPFRVKWSEVPGRDENYKVKTIAALGGGAKGLRKWRQEYECYFTGSGGTLIEGEILEQLNPAIILESQFQDHLLIYEQPQENENYIIISDVSEGVGGDYSTCQVFKIRKDDFLQVAVYRDNEIKTNEFDMIIHRLGLYYNNALLIVEANSYGREILNRLVYDDENENVFFESEETDFGIKMNKQTKAIGNSYLKTNIETFKLVIQDFETISELSKYIKKKNTYMADDGYHDDLVTPLVIFSYFLSKKQNVENWISNLIVNKSKMQLKIESEFLPLGFICDGNQEINLNVSSDEDDEFDDF